MIKKSTRLNARIDFPSRIIDFLGRSKRSVQLCSPKKVEFKLCALLAAWEATESRDGHASHWLEIWQTQCRQRHRGKTGRTLADPVNVPLSERWKISPSETAKAYLTVRDGMRRVFDEIVRSSATSGPLIASTNPPAILFQEIQRSFKTGKSFACPEGLEMFLLTLIELFEESRGVEGDELSTRKLWHVEIRRRRLGGPPDTRTLADVAPIKSRMLRQKAFPPAERARICNQMLLTMDEIVEQLTAYLRESSNSRVGQETRAG